MDDVETKVPYDPTEKRRFEISQDEFSRERIRALNKAYRILKEEVPFFAGITVFGSLSKGKELTAETASSADMDLAVFLDDDLLEKIVDNFEQENVEFHNKVEWVLDNRPYEIGPEGPRDPLSRPANVRRAAYVFVADRIKDIVTAETKNHPVPREKIDIKNFSLSVNEDNDRSIFAEVVSSIDHFENETDLDVKKGHVRRVAAPFFLDIGGGLTKYRKAFFEKLLNLPPQEGQKYWRLAVEAMKSWERWDQQEEKIKVPDSIASTYPETLAEAVKYYTAGKSTIES